jgi:hypothetical protein
VRERTHTDERMAERTATQTQIRRHEECARTWIDGCVDFCYFEIAQSTLSQEIRDRTQIYHTMDRHELELKKSRFTTKKYEAVAFTVGQPCFNI